MKVYHLQCGVIQGLTYKNEHLICHCLLIETPADGLILIDTGLGYQDLIKPQPRFGFGFSHVYAKPERDTYLSAVEQVKKLGYKPEDVRHIILTHMDLDHVGGLVDFPWAQVHVHDLEYQTAINERHGFKTRMRYPKAFFEHHPNFVTYSEEGDHWFNFSSIQMVENLKSDILLIPTSGHSRGHTAVAINTDDGWLIHCGDTYFDPAEIQSLNGTPEPQLARFEWVNQWNKQARLENLKRLYELKTSHPEVQLLCAHNPAELHHYQNISQLPKQAIISHPSQF